MNYDDYSDENDESGDSSDGSAYSGDDFLAQFTASSSRESQDTHSNTHGSEISDSPKDEEHHDAEEKIENPAAEEESFKQEPIEYQESDPGTGSAATTSLLMGIKQETQRQLQEAEPSRSDVPLHSIPRKKSKRPAFVCTVPGCQKSYGRLNGLQIHVRMKHESATFKCDHEDCGKEFPLASTLENHKKVHDGKQVMCDVQFCCRKFKNVDEMRRHARVHLEVRPVPCIIPDCTLTFSYPKALDSHLERSHPGEHSFPCAHPDCNKVFNKFHLLKFHEGVHSIEKTFQCPFEGCTSVFSTYYYRNSHVYKCHKAVDKLPCKICGKRFKYGSTLNRHLETHVKTRTKTYLCPQCGKGFSSSETLRRHSAMHSDERPFLCTDCGISFKRKEGLTNHCLQQHSDKYDVSKPFACCQCGKATRTKVGLEIHMRTHEVTYKIGAADPDGTCATEFTCPEPSCGKTFKLKKYMIEHAIVHAPETHVCTLCDKRFKCSRYLKIHMQTHSEVRRFMCSVCGKAFKTSKEHRRHREIHETERKYVCPKPNCGRSYKTGATLRVHLKLHRKNDMLQRDFRKYKPSQAQTECTEGQQAQYSFPVDIIPQHAQAAMLESHQNTIYQNFLPPYKYGV